MPDTDQDEKTHEDDTRALRDAVTRLQERFDCVQIFASRYDHATGNTYSVTDGAGNLHARRDQAQEWLVVQDEYSRGAARRRDRE